MNTKFILPTSKAAVKRYMLRAGIKPSEGFERLAQKGLLHLTDSVSISYCRHRYNIIDDIDVGGASVAEIVDAEDREFIPAAQPDLDGNYLQRVAQEAKDLSNSVSNELLRRRLLGV